MRDYGKTVVKKPWGYEYLAYENPDVGLWLLRILPGQSTSLHCHPRKSTGLVILRGTAEISFLSNKMTIEAPGKLMIRRGLFHSTRAVSNDGLFVFEIESPNMKGDLVRLEDPYGRKLEPYEGEPYHEERPESCLWIDEARLGQRVEFCELGLMLRQVSDASELDPLRREDLMICLRGGLINGNNDPIFQPGDVVDGATLDLLSKTFRFNERSLLLTVTSEA